MEIIEPKFVCMVGESQTVEYGLKNNLPHDVHDLKVSVVSMKVKKYGKSTDLVRLKTSYAEVKKAPEKIVRGQTTKFLVKVTIPTDYNEKAEYKEGKRIEVAPILKFFIKGIKEIRAY